MYFYIGAFVLTDIILVFFVFLIYIGDCTGEGDGKKKVDSKENASLTVLVKLAEKSSELMNMLKNFKFF